MRLDFFWSIPLQELLHILRYSRSRCSGKFGVFRMIFGIVFKFLTFLMWVTHFILNILLCRRFERRFVGRCRTRGRFHEQEYHAKHKHQKDQPPSLNRARQNSHVKERSRHKQACECYRKFVVALRSIPVIDCHTQTRRHGIIGLVGRWGYKSVIPRSSTIAKLRRRLYDMRHLDVNALF